MIRVGTSGFQYPEWRGTFYPEKLSTAKMLPFYAGRFSTTEINYTFYRFPSIKTLDGWSEATPGNFSFSLKAPRRITHDARLKDCSEMLHRFVDTLATLGPKFGAVLFQLPPNFKKDCAILNDFLNEMPHGLRAAFEFRHPSWHDEETFATLKDHNVALCVADSEKLSTPVVTTADHGYFRLRHEGYTAKDLERWAEVIRGESRKCPEIFVYFKHEEKGLGPEFARRLIELVR